MSTWQRWILGGALVLGAGLVSVITPSDQETLSPMAVRGEADETVTSRTLSAAVISATFAERVASEQDDWEASGNWLVIELSASASQTEVGAEIALAALHVDGLVFHASERIPDSLLLANLHVGTATVGALGFELPNGIGEGAAELWLSSESPTPRLDDVIVLRLSLDDVPSTPSYDVAPPTAGAP